MTDLTILPKSFTPNVEIISAREILYLLSPTAVPRHVSLLFRDTEQLISFRVQKGYIREFWTNWPSREDDAVETLKKDGMDFGLSAESNCLYIVDYDIDEYRQADQSECDDIHKTFRLDLCDAHMDAGDDCLTGFYSPELREFHLCRISRGFMSWYWGSNMMSYSASIETLAEERKRTGLRTNAAPLYVIDKDSLARAAQLKSRKNSLTPEDIGLISAG